MKTGGVPALAEHPNSFGQAKPNHTSPATATTTKSAWFGFSSTTRHTHKTQHTFACGHWENHTDFGQPCEKSHAKKALQIHIHNDRNSNQKEAAAPWQLRNPIKKIITTGVCGPLNRKNEDRLISLTQAGPSTRLAPTNKARRGTAPCFFYT